MLCTGRPRNLGLIPGGWKRFIAPPKRTDQPWRPPSLPLLCKGAVFPGVEWPAYEAEHSPNLVLMVGISGAITLLLHSPSRRAQEEL